ncbi:MAG TPA: hypothetical protein VHI78_14205 [Bacteroidales bacterium]|nr:hypothetical protein [Bacteroidales bacterium]
MHKGGSIFNKCVELHRGGIFITSAHNPIRNFSQKSQTNADYDDVHGHVSMWISQKPVLGWRQISQKEHELERIYN